MASWTGGDEHTVSITRRVTSFTVVCDACIRAVVPDAYGGAVAREPLGLESRQGRVTCPNGHDLRVEHEFL
jgi:hypothetical protein